MIFIRRILALLRLILLYTLLSLCIFHLGLIRHAGHARGAEPQGPLPPATAPAMRIPFLGSTVALEQFNSQERAAALARLRAHGFGWVRQRFDWRTLEPAPGRFDWQRSDAILHDIAGSGLVPVVVLDGSPSWARAPIDTGANNQPLAPPADPADFATFAAQFATRYADTVRFYQVWDEPNIAPHWGNRHIEPVDYARLLAAAGAAIRTADADAVILTAALAPTLDMGHTAIDETYFLQRLYAAQAPHAPPLFDAVAIQPYGFRYAPDAVPRHALHFRRAEQVRQTMVAAGDGTTPVWAVRYGWNRRSGSPWSTVTPATQAEFATAALELAHDEWPWLAALGWAIDQPSQPHDDPVWGFALNLRLLLRFANQRADEPARGPATAEASPSQSVGQTVLLWGLLVVAGWRGWAATRIFPWRAWTRRVRTAPIWVRSSCWLLLLATYYLATWPPLLVLCLLGAVYLNHVWRLDGLCLAALVLPFTFQHKEIHLLDSTWIVTPVQAVLLSLLPSLLVHLVHLGVNTTADNSCAFSRVELRKDLSIYFCRDLLVRRRRDLVRMNVRMDWWNLLAGLWLLIGLLSAWNVWHWPAYSDGFLQLTLVPLLLFVMVRVLVADEAALRRVCAALFLGGILVALIGLWRWLRGDGTGADGVLRLVGPHFSPNHTALYLERTLFLGAGFVVASQGQRAAWMRLLWSAGCGLILIALLLTASRGAIFFGLPTGFAAGYLLLRARAPGGGWHLRVPMEPSQVRRTLVVGGLLLGGLMWIFRERLLNSDTLIYRWEIWRATLQLWWEYPWTGVGPGGFFWRYPAYVLETLHADPNLQHPHNLWLEFMALWGVFGLLWLLAFLWLLLRDLRDVRAAAPQPWPYLGLLVALLAGLSHAQFDTFAALADLAAWNWLALGVWSRYLREPSDGEQQDGCHSGKDRADDVPADPTGLKALAFGCLRAFIQRIHIQRLQSIIERNVDCDRRQLRTNDVGSGGNDDQGSPERLQLSQAKRS